MKSTFNVSDEAGQALGDRYRRAMSVTATIVRAATGEPVQKMTFGRIPRLYAAFNLQSGELVQVQRIEIGKPAPGKFIAPVTIWVEPKM